MCCCEPPSPGPTTVRCVSISPPRPLSAAPNQPNAPASDPPAVCKPDNLQRPYLCRLVVLAGALVTLGDDGASHTVNADAADGAFRVPALAPYN